MERVTDVDFRIVALVSTRRDGGLLQANLDKAGVASVACTSCAELSQQLSLGAGAVLLTDDVMTCEAEDTLRTYIDNQQPWSDLPILIFSSGAEFELRARTSLVAERYGNVTLLERPVRLVSLISAVRSALRSRQRQYAVRDYLARCEELSRQLAEAAQRKDEFLAMLGHELRNPLAAASTAVQLLQVAAPESDAALSARKIAELQMAHMSRLVGDLLDMSRLARGRVQLKKSHIDVASLCQMALDTMQATIKSRNQHFECRMPAHPITIHADETRMRQVLENLLSNASKYTPAGGRIVLTGEQIGNELALTVEDTGDGISKELMPHIFEPFSQEKRSLARSDGGLGIGLSVVKSLVDLHGGTIQAYSDGPGKGSKFVVRLPVLTDHTAASDPESGEPHGLSESQLRVLIVDDNEQLAHLLGQLIESFGHRVRIVNDGIPALTTAQEFKPELVLLDIGLPGIDGYEVARRLRASTEIRQPVIAAVTGYGQEEDRQRARRAGFDRHLVKPLTVGALNELFAIAQSTEVR